MKYLMAILCFLSVFSWGFYALNPEQASHTSMVIAFSITALVSFGGGMAWWISK